MKSGRMRWTNKAEEPLRLLRDNRDEVIKQNRGSLTRLLAVVGGISFCLSIWHFWGRKASIVALCYAFIWLTNLGLYAAGRTARLQAHPLYGLYFEAVICMGVAMYLSLLHAPSQKATVLLGLFCILPLILMDSPWRINAFLAGCFILHTALAFLLKPANIAKIDTVNSLGFCILGICLGDACTRGEIVRWEPTQRVGENT